MLCGVSYLDFCDLSLLLAARIYRFLQAVFLRVLLTAFGTRESSFKGFPYGIHNFGIWSTSNGLGRIVRPSLHNILTLPPWEYGVGWISVCRCWFWFFSSFLIVIIFMFLTPCFPRAANISSSVANPNFLLLITPLKMLNISCG